MFKKDKNRRTSVREEKKGRTKNFKPLGFCEPAVEMKNPLSLMRVALKVSEKMTSVSQNRKVLALQENNISVRK